MSSAGYRTQTHYAVSRNCLHNHSEFHSIVSCYTGVVILFFRPMLVHLLGDLTKSLDSRMLVIQRAIFHAGNMVHRCLLSTIFLLKFFGVSESAYQPICTNIARRRPDDFVIVAHSDHESWNCTLRAIDTLSSCGISNVIIDLRLVQDSNSLPFSCRSGKPLIALNCAAGLSAHTSCGPVRWLDISSTGSDVTSDTFHHTAIPDSANKNGVYRDERNLRVATLPVRWFLSYKEAASSMHL